MVFNTPGANANGVKEMVIAGMLLASRDIVGGIEWIEQPESRRKYRQTGRETEKAVCRLSRSYGKRLGVIGLGAIGAMVANTAIYLGMDVYGYDPYISVDTAWNLSRDNPIISEMWNIFFGSVIISRCTFRFMDSTRGMIGKDSIEMMKEGVVLLNFARDLLVDEPLW